MKAYHVTKIINNKTNISSLVIKKAKNKNKGK